MLKRKNETIESDNKKQKIFNFSDINFDAACEKYCKLFNKNISEKTILINEMKKDLQLISDVYNEKLNNKIKTTLDICFNFYLKNNFDIVDTLIDMHERL